MVIFASQGDPRRTMALLWRDTGSAAAPDRRPGPRPGLTLDAVVAAGIEVADVDGLAGLSMRAVGERLGRTAMALYTYVSDKAELLDLMYDQVHAELVADTADGADWRTALAAWAAESWDFHLRHPWVSQVSMTRPVLGPNENAAMERLLRILRPTGVSARRTRGIVGALTHLVRGAAAMAAESRQAARETGQSEADWWYARSPVLAAVAPDYETRFPLLTWLEAGRDAADDDAVGYMENEARQALAEGLKVIVAGIDVSRTPSDTI
ncbi:TetR/AcrR family transcriptional regulator C-terminal domain-containing protein [Actinokineospora auranticolor]|uniref:Tetracycline repressor-like protein n=1 Tax=Actinokineospora auranticolor TaxID=155976 RepID=A0A2S6GNL0_9PSEU|nr:TetR/AcrR family transcriptional regulator C-terminal domain-containing protein [Actinokineospora auranticolor]PPK66819.1 tetracycline repressor-like protein [Actinokineospora auranticolor]